MNLVLRFFEALQKVSGELVSELIQMRNRINAWASAEHNTDGTHAIVTATSVALTDGITAPDVEPGKARIYVDSADGDLKVVFGDGTIKTIVTDT